MIILGLNSVSTGFHDSSAVLVVDGKIEFAISEERYTRVKHDKSFPHNSILTIFKKYNLSPGKIDGVAIAWKPYNPFSGFLGHKLLDVPRTVLFSAIMQPMATLDYTWNNFIKFKIFKNEDHVANLGFLPEKIHYFSHHLCHASSSYRTSGFDEALSVNFDCFGPDDQGDLWSGASYVCRNNNIELLEYIPPHASLGLFYSSVSVGLGFKFVDGEGKTMGLSAYGDPEKAYRALRVIAPSFQNNKWLGHSSWSDFRLIESPTLMFNTKWGRYLRNVVKNHERADVAAAAQRILEEELNNYINYLLAKTKLKDLVLAGGIFLNVTFNGKLSRRKDINSIYIHPYPADGGTAAGAALELHARLSQNNTNYLMTSAYLGTSYEESEIQRALDSFGDKINYDRVDNISELAATLIKEGEIIGWFQGRAEWGPRALGNRSVLGDPRNSDTRERLNKLLKNRDWFMPFAPSILEEYLDEYFENSFFAPFMTFAFIIKEEKAALIPAALHKDGTARPNVVRKDTNPRYYELIDNFRKLTGLPVVLNTSFNRHGLPLINTPKEAIDHLLWGCVDKLCIGPFIVRRNVAIQHVDRFTEEALKAAYIDEDALLSASKNMQ